MSNEIVNEFFTSGKITYIKLLGPHAEKDDIHTIVDTEFVPILLEYQWYYGKDGYAVCYEMRNFPLHRMIFRLNFNQRQPEGFCIDHINRDRLDNRIVNLRLATPQENSFNKTIAENNGLPRGVTKSNKGTYSVKLTKNKEIFKVKDIKTVKEAAEIYNEMAKSLYGEFAVLNNDKN